MMGAVAIANDSLTVHIITYFHQRATLQSRISSAAIHIRLLEINLVQRIPIPPFR